MGERTRCILCTMPGYVDMTWLIRYECHNMLARPK